MKFVDINCDLGESFGQYQLGQDKEILQLISSANIACGFHAGDPRVMYETVKLCQAKGVAVGAHPGYPDLNGFGRREMKLTPDEVYQLMIYQIGALQAFAKVLAVSVEHVKPHGALYNQAAKDQTTAEAIAQAVADVDENLILFGLAGSKLVQTGRGLKLQVAEEVFADRSYQSDGSLTPRNKPGAMIHDSNTAVNRVIKMIKESQVEATDGSMIKIQADTICLHGDEPTALEFAKKIQAGLLQAGIEIRKVGGRK